MKKSSENEVDNYSWCRQFGITTALVFAFMLGLTHDNVYVTVFLFMFLTFVTNSALYILANSEKTKIMQNKKVLEN